jgi:ECF transporter S component (folate family)
MKQKHLRQYVVISILIALSVVLRMFALGVGTNNRIIIHNIPLMIIGLNFGPFAGALAGFICDLSSAPYQAGWTPLFMITTVLWGFIPGILGYYKQKRSVSYLVVIETITHIIVSASNTVLLGILYGWDIALGSVRLNRPYDFIITLFEHEYIIFHIGDFIYLRIVFVIVIMLIKIPLDVVLLRSILRRNIIPSYPLEKLGLKDAKKI